jgi:tetratricopeptide (TPR) repeat protein
LHHNPNYTKAELDSLENMLLSPDEASVKLALELIKNNGFHDSLQRPLALLSIIMVDLDYKCQSSIEKIYKSRIDSQRRAELRRELALLTEGFDRSFEDSSEKIISRSIDLFQLCYGQYMDGRQHLLESFYEIARILRRNEDTHLARRCYLIAIQWQSTHQNTFFELALLYQNDLEWMPEAEQAYLEALKLDSSDYVAHNNLAQVYEAMGQIEHAETHLLAALLIDPNYVHSVINLAYIRWRHQTQYEGAYALYEQALQIDPYDGFALCNFAELLMLHFGEYKRAEKYLKDSLDMEEEDEEAWRLLGDLSLMGPKPNIKSAKKYYKKALYYKPDDEKAQLKLDNLDKLDPK